MKIRWKGHGIIQKQNETTLFYVSENGRRWEQNRISGRRGDFIDLFFHKRTQRGQE